MVFPTKRRVPRHIPTDVYTIGLKVFGAIFGREGDSNGYRGCGIRRKVEGGEG